MGSEVLLKRLRKQKIALQRLANKQRIVNLKAMAAKKEKKELKAQIKQLKFEASKDFLSRGRRALSEVKKFGTSEDFQRHKSKLKRGFSKFQKWANKLPVDEF